MLDRYFTRNDITIHVVDCEAMAAVYHVDQDIAHLKMIEVCKDVYISTMLTMGDMAKFMLGDATYDFATPMSFWNSREDWRDCIWLYTPGDYAGKPYNVKYRFIAWVKEQI